MKMHYSHGLAPSRLSQIVGAFIVLPVLALIVLGLFMARAEHLFDTKYRLYTSLTHAYGLEPGSPVLVAGIPVGRVDAIELNEHGAVDVTLRLLDRHRELIRADSVANVGKSGLFMGQAQMEVTRGDPSKPPLEDGGRLQAVEPRDFAELVNDIKPAVESVQRTLTRVEEFTKELQTTVQTGTRVLANVERATAELPEVVATVKRTAQAVEQTADDLPQISGAVKATIQRVDGVVGDVRAATKKLPAVMDTAQDAVANVRSATASVKQLAQDLNRDVPGLVRNGQSAMDDVNRILAGAKKTFPVTMMIKNAGAAPAPPVESGLRSLRGDELAR
ncbi:MAG TPA: MlaD family protein [Nitrospirales bacterium]|nr:MlaD family protein [Nitrospirales bacterium]